MPARIKAYCLRLSGIARILPLLVIVTSGVVNVEGVWRSARAGESNAFATLGVSLDLVANTNNELFHTYWDPTGGVRVEVDTPFYLGAIALGLHVYNNDNKTSDVPSFWSTYVYLGWLGAVERGAFGLRYGALAGNFIMDFGDPALGNVSEIESELGLAATMRLSYAFAERWSAQGGVEFRRIYTAQRIDLVFFSLGVRRTFDAPNWFREFLE